MFHMDQRQTLWVGTAASPPGTVFKVYVHLFHKVPGKRLFAGGECLALGGQLHVHACVQRLAGGGA